MAFSVNKCGGKRWSTHPNWMVEVEGESFPVVRPGSERYGYMEKTWNNWGGELERAAQRYNLPVSWLLAIASIETGFVSHKPETQRQIVSPAGAQGVMQLMPFIPGIYGGSSADRSDPERNIDYGAHLVSDLARGRTGPELPHIGSAYNAGSGSGSDGVRCSTGRNEWNLAADHNYPRQIVEYNNAAIHYLGVNGSHASLWWGVAGVIAAGAAVAALYHWAPERVERFM